ncbi:MAG: hypothetical protein M0Z89_04080 [Nitrospiraceae bacterium]|nr:hypothetical protein [Nitrospiraceae bacterium]
MHKAWEQFKPVTLPPADFKPVKVTSEDIEAKYEDELETLAGQRLTHLSAEYREKLVKKPGDLDALTQLGILYGRVRALCRGAGTIRKYVSERHG